MGTATALARVLQQKVEQRPLPGVGNHCKQWENRRERASAVTAAVLSMVRIGRWFRRVCETRTRMGARFHSISTGRDLRQTVTNVHDCLMPFVKTLASALSGPPVRCLQASTSHANIVAAATSLANKIRRRSKPDIEQHPPERVPLSPSSRSSQTAVPSQESAIPETLAL